DLPREPRVDVPSALAETLLVYLRIGKAASAMVVQLDDHRLLRLVTHDAGTGARPAQAASEGPDPAEFPREPGELAVGREGPEDSPERGRVHHVTEAAASRPCHRHRLPERLLGLVLGIGATHDPSPPLPDAFPVQHAQPPPEAVVDAEKLAAGDRGCAGRLGEARGDHVRVEETIPLWQRLVGRAEA